MDRRERTGTTDAMLRHDAGAGHGGAAPGKRTLTQSIDPTVAAPVQRVAAADASQGADGEATRRTAAAGVAGAGGPLPHRDRIQQLFGPAHDVSSISAHVGGRAAEAAGQIGARAYATGTSVAFAEAPDLHTAAHEAAHVVQQRAGVQLKGGVGEAGDAYEQHADAVADRVVRGESAADLLEAGPTGQGGGETDAVQLAPAPGAQKVISDLDSAIAKGEWEVIRERVYPRAAAPAHARANKRRAGKIPDLKGLGTVASLDAIAAAIKALQTAWGGKTPDERAAAIVAAGSSALTAANVPGYLDHDAKDMTPRGQFSRTFWKLNLRKATVRAASLNNEEAGEVANTVAHESRHAEQHFLRARYLAGTGMDAADIEAATGVESTIVGQAVNIKLNRGDPRFAEAKKMDKNFGADGAKNRAISDKVDDEIKKLDTLRADAVAARSALQGSATAATIADGKKKLKALKAQILKVEKAYLAYRAIPSEADAHEVGDSAAEAFSKLP